MKPFIILALPRTGTKMLVDALNSHPDISSVTHEFRGTEDKYWEHPYVLSNVFEDWMFDEHITRIHLYREDAIAGAKSLLLMSYQFPDKQFVIPPNEVVKIARFRKARDKEFSEVCSVSVSYEALCNNQHITQLPAAFTSRFCKAVGVVYHPLTTDMVMSNKQTPKNQEELSCLRV